MGRLDESCLWMVDCRFAASNGSAIHALGVREVLGQIIQ
jgi:hypothetical protein